MWFLIVTLTSMPSSRASRRPGEMARCAQHTASNPSRTEIGERAFIGCNVNLVAPLVVEADSFVAAGSTITTRVPSEALAVARSKQRNVEGWVARRRRRE